ncbi:hypothetical protein JD969_01265 [Planctomycetota bacterium]|nr:hypothetical protein JD969_01265 [Planctomycetota bacterium]
MPLKNKGSIAPFEIMRRAEEQAKLEERFADEKGEEPVEEKVESQSDQAKQREPLPSGRARKAWWAAFDEPVILRVPRGIAVAICFGVLTLIGMAYWVGESRGAKATRAAIEEEGRLMEIRLPGLRAGRGAPNSLGEPLVKNERYQAVTLMEQVYNVTNDIVVPPDMDPRVLGENYLQVTTCSREKAVELMEFLLSRHEVETAAFTSYSKELVTVVALKGFRVTQDPESEGYKFRSAMLRVGRDWQKLNGRNTKDLSDMFFAKYDENVRQKNVTQYKKNYGQ